MAKKRKAPKKRATPKKKKRVDNLAAWRKSQKAKKRKAPKKRKAVKKRATPKKRKAKTVGKRKRKYYTSVKVNPSYTGAKKKRKAPKKKRKKSHSMMGSIAKGGAFTSAHNHLTR